MRPTPFHPRTAELCTSHLWKHWAGYLAVCRYGMSSEREYNAIRQGSALIDVTPLFKYEVRGPDAGRFLARVMSRDVSKLKVGRATYLCWTDDDGKVLDDGTCQRFGEEWFRVTAAAASFGWLARNAGPYDVSIDDVTGSIGALALQGPTSRDLLAQICDADLEKLRFFGVTEVSFDRAGDRGELDGWLTRTGYTGDLGYELWVPADGAVALYDRVMAEGRRFGIEPVGIDALDVARIEAGFIMQDVDYFSAHDALIPSQKSSPYEIGLGWTVKLDREPFIGQSALRVEKERGPAWAMVGLELDWEAIEALYDGYGLPPALPAAASREAVPIYAGRSGRSQVGRATSRVWSPILKRPLALATVQSRFAEVGTVLDIEMTVEWERRRVPCCVVKTPFFDPPRKRA